MLKRRSLAEAKAKLSECVSDVEHGVDTIITRNGKPVAALVPVVDLEELRRLRAARPRGGLASLAGTLPDADDFLDALGQPTRVGARNVPPLGST
jgi:prevent-host-death family protein